MVARRLVVSLALALVGMTVPAAASYAVTPSDLYVATAADGGDDTHDCSQVDPCATVQHAVDLAAAAGTTIHIGAGSFSGEIQPGAKSVAFEGVSTDETTLTTPEDSVDGFVLGVTTGTTTLTKVTVQGGLLMDVWVSGDATFTADDVVLAQAGCGLVVVGGAADLTDSTVEDGGPGCLDIPTPPGNIVVTGGQVSVVRTQVLKPAEGVAGVAVTGGAFSADQTYFDNSAHDPDTDNSPAIRVQGGAATISRSTVHHFQSGVITAGGTTSITDSTFDGNVVGVTSESGSATVVRSTIQGGLASVQGEGGELGVAGSLLGAASIRNCAGTITDLGYNLAATAADTDPGCSFTQTTSHDGVTGLNLDSGLADRGGPVPTVAVLWPSAAADTIPVGATYGDDGSPLCPGSNDTDLRGVDRAAGGACDAGSMEMARTATTIDALARIKPHKDLDLDVTISVPQVDLGLDAPNGTVTLRDGDDVVCADVPVVGVGARCTVSNVAAGKHRFSAHFSPTVGSTLHPSTSKRAIVLVGTAPVIKGPHKVRLEVGRKVSITLSTSGSPTPALRKVGGHLPRGLSLHRHDGQITISGRPKPSAVGRHRLRVRATNLMGQDAHRLTLVVRRR